MQNVYSHTNKERIRNEAGLSVRYCTFFKCLELGGPTYAVACKALFVLGTRHRTNHLSIKAHRVLLLRLNLSDRVHIMLMSDPDLTFP